MVITIPLHGQASDQVVFNDTPVGPGTCYESCVQDFSVHY